MTPAQCAQPGCAGHIADGFCDVCGAEPAPGAPATPAVSGPASAGSRPAGHGTADGCGRPGCTGTIVDGFCDVCGSAAAPAAPAAAVRGSGSSGPGGGPGSTPSRPGRGTRGSGGSGGSGARRGLLGAGLVTVPPVPERDPASAIMADPRVPESKRYCGNCTEPVGRGRDGRPGRTEGFCKNCGMPFSFTPKLAPGDLVAGQYEVLGCLAHGGLGWVYLARDLKVAQRWVVLKGLLDTGDAEARAAAAAELVHLASAEHANIVKVYNSVEHPDARTGAKVGYIVMEYVGGQSLKDILLARRRELGPDAALPLPQVIAYGLELLRALDYLHDRGRLYCDLKPDNAIQSNDELKLIDLGGVRRMDDQESAIYGTIGYQAPEIADRGPSIASDLYTVGRTLAVLSFLFKGYTSTYATTLPPRADVPVLAGNESYDRLLRRATHADPDQRFADASEMSDQLYGVLREVLAAEDGQERPGASTLFGPDRFPLDAEVTDADPGGRPLLPVTPGEAAAALPVPLVDGADPAAGFLAGLTGRGLPDMASALRSAPVRSSEVLFTQARVHIELGDLEAARGQLYDLAHHHPDDWRVVWYRGVHALASGAFDDAAALFDEVYDRKPGEAAAKLACAVALEQAGRPREAARLYDMVWRTDRSYVSAAFGLARAHLAAGDRERAIAVLDSVPPVSSFHISARLAAVATAVRGQADLTEAGVLAAGQRLENLRLDPERHERMAAEVCEAALRLLSARPPDRPSGRRVPPPRPGARLLGVALTEDDVRRRLERGYRELAGLSRVRERKVALVDRANAVRPRTLL